MNIDTFRSFVKKQSCSSETALPLSLAVASAKHIRAFIKADNEREMWSTRLPLRMRYLFDVQCDVDGDIFKHACR